MVRRTRCSSRRTASPMRRVNIGVVRKGTKITLRSFTGERKPRIAIIGRKMYYRVGHGISKYVSKKGGRKIRVGGNTFIEEK